MQDIADEESLSIAPFQLVSLGLEQQHTIRILCGQVWITIEADVHDYWLAAGETMVLPQHRHIVIEASAQHSSIDVRPQAQPRSQRVFSVVMAMLRVYSAMTIWR